VQEKVSGIRKAIKDNQSVQATAKGRRA